MKRKNAAGYAPRRKAPLWYGALLLLLFAVAAGLVWHIAVQLGFFSLPAQSAATLAGPVLTETPDAGQQYLAETVFVGDSNTVRLYRQQVLSQAQCMGKEGISVDAVPSLAFVQVSGRAALYTVPEALALVQPRWVVLTFGTNSIGNVGLEAFTAQYRAAIAAIRQAYSGCDIIVNSIPPIAQQNSYPKLSTAEIQAYNDALLALCGQEKVYFLNSFEALAAEDGYAKQGYMLEDGIHLTQTALQAMVGYVRTHAIPGA
ncbi:MAG: SGNH/GDSL hydrolase family protein [Oscillospiraceae bacterium]